MKKFFIAMLAVCFVAGAAYAVDYDFSGMINTRGSYLSNDGSESDDPGAYMYYDMEVDQTLKIKPTDKTLIYLNWEIHDENWNATPNDSNTKTGDDQIAFKRAFGSVNFDMGGSLDFGLMTGGAWASDFGNNANGKYRLKWTQKTGFGVLVGVLEKNGEVGPDATGDYDAEKDDSDAYYVAAITKVGDISIKPLLGYVQVGNIDDTDPDPDNFVGDEETDAVATVFLLGVDGAFGAIGFEAEFNWKSYTYETDIATAEDYSVYGLYANAWMNMDAMKVGALFAYGSYDKDGGLSGKGAGFGFGEDFCPGYWVCDWDNFGSGPLAEYYAATLFVLYGDYAVSDALSLNAAFEYMMSNEEETYYEDATGWIVNFGGSYALADNVKYSFGFAQGQYTFDTDLVEDPDPFTRLYHKIQINF